MIGNSNILRIIVHYLALLLCRLCTFKDFHCAHLRIDISYKIYVFARNNNQLLKLYVIEYNNYLN
jgi:hypothetical protein